MALLGGGLVAIGISHDQFFEAAYPLHWLVGPMTALLAIPLHCQIRRIGCVILPVVGILSVGSSTAVVSSSAAALITGSDPALVMTLAPKSVTTAVAIGLSESLGGIPGITAVVVILTAVVGVTAAPLVFRT